MPKSNFKLHLAFCLRCYTLYLLWSEKLKLFHRSVGLKLNLKWHWQFMARGLSLSNSRIFVQPLLKKAQNQLVFKVKIRIKTVDWTNFELKDDLTNILDHYSFITSPNNSLIKDRVCLLQGFMVNRVMRSFFTWRMNGEVLWERKACIEWLKRCKKLLEMLAVLCHLLGGQPARASELATLRGRNSVDEQRGVYWVNGTVMLLAMYTKTRSITCKNKLIPRWDLMNLLTC